MNNILRKTKNRLLRISYKIIFSYLDKNLNFLFEFFERKQGLIEEQAIFNRFHLFGLKGMNYGNSEPETNGEYFLLKTIAKIFSGKEKLIIFDVGANVGDYAKKVKMTINNSIVHCFEPSFVTFDNLKNNTKQFADIIYNNIGLGETSKEIILYKNSDVSGLASIYNRNLDHLNIKMDLQEIIKITTLDEYCKTNKIEKIDFLKLDVEGNEYNTFKGATRMLSEKRIKYMQFEMGGCNIHSKTSWQEIYYLLNPNYKLYRIVKDGIIEFKEYSEYDEIFVYANYFAESK